jgi:23S rRNA (uracil1939-C5)-methyltransferase
LNYQFKISLQSFYQVNPSMMEVLYKQAITLADIQPDEVVLDCYCGIGTIALVASGYAKQVYGIEVNPQAIEDAKENAILNKVDNASFLCMDAKEALTYFDRNKINIDTLIVDPPRSGLHESLVDAIIESNISKVVYVSCNPKTLARDVAKLSSKYIVEVVQPVDMFPQTKHVETVVLMSRK